MGYITPHLKIKALPIGDVKRNAHVFWAFALAVMVPCGKHKLDVLIASEAAPLLSVAKNRRVKPGLYEGAEHSHRTRALLRYGPGSCQHHEDY